MTAPLVSTFWVAGGRWFRVASAAGSGRPAVQVAEAVMEPRTTRYEPRSE